MNDLHQHAASLASRAALLLLLAAGLVHLRCGALASLAGAHQLATGPKPARPPDFELQSSPPDFPKLFDARSAGKLKISSRVLDCASGEVQLSEEYIDVGAGKAALVLTSMSAASNVSREGRARTLLSEALSDGFYVYEPYACSRFNSAELAQEHMQYWYSITYKNNYGYIVGSEPRRAKQLRLFNVAAAWLLAESRLKQYSQRRTTSMGANDLSELLIHTWTLNDDSKFSFEFEFLQDASQAQASYRAELELYQVRVYHNGTLGWLVRVLALEFELDQQAQEEVLQLPLGFGCSSELENFAQLAEDLRLSAQNIEQAEGQLNELFQPALRLHGALVEFEVSAHSGRAGVAAEQAYVQLAHSQALERAPGLQQLSGGVTLTRIRRPKSRLAANESDLRVVSNYDLGVRYSIDVLTGECQPSHIKLSEQADDEQQLTLKFAGNSLELSLHKASLELLLEQLNQFKLVKTIETGQRRKPEVDIYLERSLDRWPPWPAGSGELRARIVRQYRASRLPSPLGLERSRGGLEALSSHDWTSVRLISVRLLVFDETSSELLQSFRLSLLNQQVVEHEGQLARLLDVSQECYLDNDEARAGHDYAWLRLLYPVPMRELDEWAQRRDKLELVFRQLLLHEQLQLGAFQAPRLEFEFDERGLEARFLVLDEPAAELRFERHQGVSIAESAGATELASSVQHCARLCKQNLCASFTYCAHTHACLLGLRPLDLDGWPELGGQARQAAQATRAVAGCDSYGARPGAAQDAAAPAGQLVAKSRRLSELVSQLQSQDYSGSAWALPAPPTELADPRQAALLPAADLYLGVINYNKQLLEYLANNSDLIPKPVLRFQLKQRRLSVTPPARFVLEQDPLREVELLRSSGGGGGGGGDGGLEGWPSDQEFEQGDLDAAFRGALSLAHFKMNALLMGRPETSQVRAHFLTGLTYQQCAAACLDLAYGTFSYCEHRRECIVLGLRSLAEAQALELVERDDECSIAERDFLRDFSRFRGVALGALAPASTSLGRTERRNFLSASECARECLAERQFECMSFEHCVDPQANYCHFHSSRMAALAPDLGLGAARAEAGPGSSPPAQPEQAERQARAPEPSPNCDHYERSPLADFVQLDHRQFRREALAGASSSLVEGKSVSACASLCQLEPDCSAFQFCSQASSETASNPLVAKRECKLLQGLLAGQQGTTSLDDGPPIGLVVDDSETGLDPAAKQQQQQQQQVSAFGPAELPDSFAGAVVSAGERLSSMLEYSKQCNVFAMRKFSSSAHLRQLALGQAMSANEKLQLDRASLDAIRANGASLGSALLLLGALFGASTGLVYAAHLVYERNVFVQQQVQRVRLLLAASA